jgi:hypothetical protein
MVLYRKVCIARKQIAHKQAARNELPEENQPAITLFAGD